jgi:small GTP-binding protein
MIQRKICMLGAFAAGKTSLVRRFVHSIFSEKYQTSIGVKVDRKELEVAGDPVLLMLWDLAGEDEFQKVRTSYLRGSSGLFFVADGTRRDTVDRARHIWETTREVVGDVPAVLAVNKRDLTDDWALSDDEIARLAATDWKAFLTSAKTGTNVDDAFHWLARQTVETR